MSETSNNGRCPVCSRMLMLQKYRPVTELAWLFAFSDSTIKNWANQELFGPPADFLRVGNDIRIPDSGALFFINNHLNTKSDARRMADQVRGRSLGEARRRLLQQGPNV